MKLKNVLNWLKKNGKEKVFWIIPLLFVSGLMAAILLFFLSAILEA